MKDLENVTDIENVTVDVLAFALYLKTSQSFQGVFTFILFALRFRVRVYLWCNMEKHDIVKEYAAWASPDLFSDSRFEVIACYRDGAGRLAVPDDVRQVNHFVACVRCVAGGGGGHAPDNSEDEGTKVFRAFYLSQGRVVIPTIADGDCGPDAMCVLLNTHRTILSRQKLRHTLAAFLLKHAQNRALIHTMCALCEHTIRAAVHLFEETGERHGHVVPPRDACHGDGKRRSCSELALRSFSPLQTAAIRFRCGLQEATIEHVLGVLKLLPSDCIETFVTQYEEREVERLTPEKRPKFLDRRNMLPAQKNEAVEYVLPWVQKKFPTTSLSRLKSGRWPRYCWPKFRNDHKSLSQVPSGSCKRRYKRLVMHFLKDEAAGGRTLHGCGGLPPGDGDPGDGDPAATRMVVASDAIVPVGTTKTPRTGMQYHSHRCRVKKDFERKRGIDGGRYRSCPEGLREFLLDWYSRIQHSIDCRIMCRLLKKVFLVKASMLQQEHCGECLTRELQPGHVQIDGGWLNHFRGEYGLTSRKPNRKIKVPRRVLSERLAIFRTNVVKVRTMVMEHFGYDRDIRNIDRR